MVAPGGIERVVRRIRTAPLPVLRSLVLIEGTEGGSGIRFTALPLCVPSATSATLGALGGGDLMATIRQKGRRWQVVWNTYQEARRVQRCRTFATNAAARHHRARMELLEQRGVGVVRTTLIEYLTGW